MTVPFDATAKRRRQQQKHHQRLSDARNGVPAGTTRSTGCGSGGPDDARKSRSQLEICNGAAAKSIVLAIGAVLVLAALVPAAKKIVSDSTRAHTRTHHLRVANDDVQVVSSASDAGTTITTDDGGSRPDGSSSSTDRPQIIYTIFAGRRNRMKIQEPYWKEMVRIDAIDAVHAWDYVSGGADDKKYLEELERKYDFFRIMRPHDVSMSDFYWFDRNHSLPTALERFGDDEKEGRARFSWPPDR